MKHPKGDLSEVDLLNVVKRHDAELSEMRLKLKEMKLNNDNGYVLLNLVMSYFDVNKEKLKEMFDAKQI